LSVLVAVKNEAANLPGCIASVSFAQEIVVVDSASADDTQAASEAAGARIEQRGERAIPSQLAIPLSLCLEARFS